MQRTTLIVFLTLWGVWTHAGASAQEALAHETSPQRGAFGVGAAAMLAGPPGVQFVYDPGQWHLDVIASATDDFFAAGVRGFYHLHTAGAADFSLGGGVGYRYRGRNSVLHPELAAQIRAFIVSNVALSTTVGATVLAVDESGFAIGGQLTGALAITYFF